MTNEEAIIYLDRLYMQADITDEYGDMCDMSPYAEALHMAQDALSPKFTCADCILGETDACPRGAGMAVDDEICEEFLQQPCEDCISREAVLDLICNSWSHNGELSIDALKALSSVNPTRIKGKWQRNQTIFGWYAKCDQCNEEVFIGHHGEYKYDYCPMCGSYNGEVIK